MPAGQDSPGQAVPSTKPPRPRRLVVLVPGYSGRDFKTWRQLRQRLESENGYKSDETEWLEFSHGTKRHTTGSLDAVARTLNAKIVAAWALAGGFDEVVLVGHSMGGAILRQAYLLAATEAPGEEPGEWAQKVIRIVLLASINRGIDTRKRCWLRCAAWMLRIVPFRPHLRMEDILRGSNFLTNLRINWIRHFGALAEAQRRGERWPDGRSKCLPLVVQVLGTQDSLVGPNDSKDILAFRSCHYLEIPGADHTSVYRLDGPNPKERYAVLRRAFAEEFSNLHHPPGSHDAPTVRRVIFLLHGIRASNVDRWITDLADRLSEHDPATTNVRHPTYGYFSAARFALPTVRRKYIRVFQDWYTEALAEYPNATFHAIAHSNGTYILGQSLLATPGMQFARVSLAGSVLPTTFPWDELATRGQVGCVRNDRANRDWPVALLCNALRGLRMRDVGTGGFAGFDGGVTREVAYYSGGHSAALSPQNQFHLIDFVLNGAMVPPAALKPSPGYYRQLSNAMPYVAMFLVLSLASYGGWLAIHGGTMQLAWTVLVFALAYVFLDIL
jgi:alpha-beta hydrolase superfamily lysophospholipase